MTCSRGDGRPVFLVWLAVALLGGAIPSAGWAQPVPIDPPPEPAAAAPARPQFLVESVVVEGTDRESVKRIVRRESLLVEGAVYDEEQIRHAIRRVRRLPFLIDARPHLRRGSAPGLYLLAIEVKDTSVFVGEAFGYLTTDFLSGGVRLGASQFFGATSQVSASVLVLDQTGSDLRRVVQANVGFDRYDLFGHASRLHVSADLRGIDDGLYQDWGLTAALVVPIARDHSLSFGASLSRSHRESSTLVLSEDGTRLVPVRFDGGSEFLTADWLFDTTDDPFAPRDGVRVRAGGRISSSRLETPLEDLRRTERSLSAFTGFARTVARDVSAVGEALLECGGPVREGGCAAFGAAGVRLVHDGPRSSYRAFLEGQVNAWTAVGGSPPPFGRSDGRSLTVRTGLRSRYGVVSLAFFHDLG